MGARTTHWDASYAEHGEDGVSWYEAAPDTSLEMLNALHVTPQQSLLDVGGGASRLAAALLAKGFANVTVLDVSEQALGLARRRLGPQAAAVAWIHTDLLTWEPPRAYDIWHDRAVFHFLVDPADRQRYRQCLRAALNPGGHVIIGAFAADGPTYCSSLPVARYNDEQLIDALGRDGLAVVETRRRLHQTPSGTAQPFTWLALTRC